jgi:hypothetical protein
MNMSEEPEDTSGFETTVTITSEWEPDPDDHPQVVVLARLLERALELATEVNSDDYSDLDREQLRSMMPSHYMTVLIFHLADLCSESVRQESRTLGWELERTISLFDIHRDKQSVNAQVRVFDTSHTSNQPGSSDSS